MTGRERFSLEAQTQARRRVVAAAEAFLRGELSVIETARRLSRLAHEVVDDWRVDSDFLVPGAIDTESDGLPIGDVRKLWDKAALRERDPLIQAFEARNRLPLEAACQSLISRFQDI